MVRWAIVHDSQMGMHAKVNPSLSLISPKQTNSSCLHPYQDSASSFSTTNSLFNRTISFIFFAMSASFSSSGNISTQSNVSISIRHGKETKKFTENIKKNFCYGSTCSFVRIMVEQKRLSSCQTPIYLDSSFWTCMYQCLNFVKIMDVVVLETLVGTSPKVIWRDSNAISRNHLSENCIIKICSFNAFKSSWHWK